MRNNTIAKFANKQAMLIVEDLTHPLWDIKEYNNIQLKFIKLNNQDKTSMRIPVFINVEDIRAVLNQIKLRQFGKVYGQQNKKNGGMKYEKQFYGGSNSKAGKSKIRKKGKLQLLFPNSPEAKIFKIKLVPENNKPVYYLEANVSIGQKSNKGAYKFTGQNRERLYFKLDEHQMLVLCDTILEYLKAKQSISIFKKFKPANEKTLQKLKKLYVKAKQKRKNIDQQIWETLKISLNTNKNNKIELTEIEAKEIIDFLENQNQQPPQRTQPQQPQPQQQQPQPQQPQPQPQQQQAQSQQPQTTQQPVNEVI